VEFTSGWMALHFESAENINLPFSSVPGGITVVPEPPAAAWLAGALLLCLCGWRAAARRRATLRGA
jgi:hypothetical protein